MRAAIYTRISLDQTGEGLGVQRQLEDCRALADRLGWEVVAHFDDNDRSAFSGRTRHGFEALLDAMANGDIDALVCWHTDRLYRTLKDLVRLLDVAKKVEIRTVTSGIIDLSTSSGRMTATIVGSVATQESEHKGERQRRANEQAAADGKWQTANRAFGYGARSRCKNSSCGDPGCLGYHDVGVPGVPFEPEASMVRQAVTDVLAGVSLNEVARQWNASGVTGTRGTEKWTASSVRRVLVNPRNAALRVYRGKIVGKGTWTPLVDEDTHNGLVAFVSQPSRKLSTSFEKKYMGSMVYRCGVCDAPMRHALAGNPTRRRYECTNGQHVTRLGEPVDQVVEDLVLGRLTSPDVHLTLDDGDEVDPAALHAQRAGLQARLDELGALFGNGDIDSSQLRSGTASLRKQLNGVDSTLADLARRSPTADLLAAGEKIRELWSTLSPDLKGKIIDEVVTIRIMPSPRGYAPFKPELVVPGEWKI